MASAMNVQATFLEGEYSLIHFPRELYANWLQPVFLVLFPQTQTLDSKKQWPNHELEGLTEDGQHTFLNVSVTPLECSVVCHTSWATKVFKPVVDALPREVRKSVFISQESFNVLSMTSGDVDIVSRIMELTSPLALAGIPIFFISTYYSDFILAPSKSRSTVQKALTDRGFVLGSYENSFVASRHGHVTPTIAPSAVPSPETVAELFERTFNFLKKRSVEPAVEPGLRLVQLSARGSGPLSGGGGSSSTFARPPLSRQGTNGHGYGHGNGNGSGGGSSRWAPTRSWLDDVDTKLYASVVSALVSRPRFFSMTVAIDDAPSFLLDGALLPLFGDSLIGDPGVELVPISLDLHNLPFEATGIVCGVAGKIVQEVKLERPGLAYLSTACAGTVILSPDQSVQAVDILRPLMVKES